jgi:hypothetical protein
MLLGILCLGTLLTLGASQPEPTMLGRLAKLLRQPLAPGQWSSRVREAAELSARLVPDQAFGSDLAEISNGTIASCDPATLEQFGMLARQFLHCGSGHGCLPDGRFRECERGSLDCYVPVHIIPPSSPEFEPGCMFDLVGNMVMIDAAWALEHRGGEVDPDSTDLNQGVVHSSVPPGGSHLQRAIETALLVDPLWSLEARRILVECSDCVLFENAPDRLAPPHDEL